MSPDEKSRIEALTSKTTTRCIGRFLINLPEQLVESTEGGPEINGASLRVVPMSERDYQNLLQAKIKDYASKVLPGTDKFPFLKSATMLGKTQTAVLFDRAENDGGTSRMGRMLELIEWKNDYAIFADIAAIDTDFPEFANDAWIKESKTTTKEKSEQLIELVSRTRGRQNGEIPTQTGLCFRNGFVAGPSTSAERVAHSFKLKNANDVFFAFSFDSSYVRSDSLVNRGLSTKPIIESAQGRILRVGKRPVDQVSEGEEFLYKMLGEPDPERKQIMTYKFTFEANNKIGSANSPLIAIDFDNGDVRPVDGQDSRKTTAGLIGTATLSEMEAVALWDAVIPSLRPRSGAF
ncbi:T6SS immunity protein Tli4 family protein [Massilia sp. TWR1-2-2]|uniref:T6SS immunity protein Tli4 family protein n=1 Tax=Massilia sp. TWR1-2-2 TaxID=2804584 RepID=UPI003CEDD88B